MRHSWASFPPAAWLAIVLLGDVLLDVISDITIERLMYLMPEQQVLLRTFTSILWAIVAYIALYRLLVKQPVDLTPREREVFILAGERLTNHQIAEALSISERTVDTYIISIRRKLGLTSRVELVRRSNKGKRS